MASLINAAGGEKKLYDIFIIGGGVNGCGVARDAAGRGLSVALAEMNDIASATSSSSTKLFHGGLRYLEHFEFRLVREALIEREVLLKAMPHISWPLRFVLPYSRTMRFEGKHASVTFFGCIVPLDEGATARLVNKIWIVLIRLHGCQKDTATYKGN